MSIPTPFNPMGTLGRELPYVQPVKTGNGIGDYSNSPSFDFSVEIKETRYPNPWRMFDADEGTYETTSTDPGIRVRKLGFERPLKILSLDILLSVTNNTVGDLVLCAYVDGERRVIGRHSRAASDTEKKWRRIEVAAPDYFADYYLGLDFLTSDTQYAHYMYWYEVNINAVYKP